MPISVARIKAIWPWLIKCRYLVFAILVVIFICLLVFYVFPSARNIRLGGLVLQLLGLTTIVAGISETRKLFDQPPFTKTFSKWLKRFPLFKQTYKSDIGMATEINICGHAPTSFVKNYSNGGDISDRVEAVEQNIYLIDKKLSEIEVRFNERTERIISDLRRESEKREAADQYVKDMFKAVNLGGIDISAAGVLFLLVGAVFSSIPEEIFSLIQS